MEVSTKLSLKYQSAASLPILFGRLCEGENVAHVVWVFQEIYCFNCGEPSFNRQAFHYEYFGLTVIKQAS